MSGRIRRQARSGMPDEPSPVEARTELGILQPKRQLFCLQPSSYSLHFWSILRITAQHVLRRFATRPSAGVFVGILLLGWRQSLVGWRSSLSGSFLVFEDLKKNTHTHTINETNQTILLRGAASAESLQGSANARHLGQRHGRFASDGR